MGITGADDLRAAIEGSLAARVLVSAAVSTVIAAYATSGQFSMIADSFMSTFVSVGAPAAVGQLIVTAIDPSPSDSMSGKMFKSLVGGGAAVALMITSGALPAIVDTQTLTLVAILGTGIYVGDMIKLPK